MQGIPSASAVNNRQSPTPSAPPPSTVEVCDLPEEHLTNGRVVVEAKLTNGVSDSHHEDAADGDNAEGVLRNMKTQVGVDSLFMLIDY